MIKYKIHIIAEFEDNQIPPIPLGELHTQVNVIYGDWIDNFKLLEKYIRVVIQ